jgi:hypothetical protein
VREPDATQGRGDVYARTPDELHSIDEAARDAPDWFVPFLDAGLHVVFELPKPVLGSHPFQCVDWFNRSNPVCAGGLSEKRSDQERYRAPVVVALARLRAQHRGVTVWDPLPVLCDEMNCNALRGARPLFFDGDHVSPYATQLLLPSFMQAVREIAN